LVLLYSCMADVPGSTHRPTILNIFIVTFLRDYMLHIVILYGT